MNGVSIGVGPFGKDYSGLTRGVEYCEQLLQLAFFTLERSLVRHSRRSRTSFDGGCTTDNASSFKLAIADGWGAIAQR
jgi:hypothetical protein